MIAAPGIPVLPSNDDASTRDARNGQATPARVLVVEDDANTRRVLVLLFQLRGYDVLETGEPQKGIDWVDARDVDLVVSDLQLPRMSGIDMAEVIARSGGAPPMIAITSGSSRLVGKAEACGHFEGVLTKPVDVNELLDLADRLIVSVGDGRASR